LPITLRIADGGAFIELPARQPKYNVITNVQKYIQKLNRTSVDGTKADSDVKPNAPTSRPTIGNTIVGSRF